MQNAAETMERQSAQDDAESHAFTYLFEAKSLQRYIFESGRLHDMVAASALIDALTRGDSSLLEHVVSALPAAERPRFSRRAGGALAAHFTSRPAVGRFRDAWTLAVRLAAPGLEFVQAEGSGASASVAAADARKALAAAHQSTVPLLPVAGPYSERAPRTGGAASEYSRKDGELVDVVTAAKRRAARTLFKRHPTRADCVLDPVAARLDVRVGNESAIWPLNLERARGGANADAAEEIAFPYGDAPPYVGIIHADGNGLGQLVMALGAGVQSLPDDQYIAVLSEFSEGLDRATHAAASTATRRALVEAGLAVKGVLPARPFILGGDDLGIIVRGDCALEFTQAFLEAFEEATGSLITTLRQRFPGVLDQCALPERLTAAAGIAYVKAQQPFYRAYELAESLCRHAKSHAKRRAEDGELVPSTVAFHRVTTSMIDDYESVRERELAVQNARDRYELSVQPWYVGCRAEAGPSLASLLELRDSLADPRLSGSRLREVLETAGLGRRREAELRYRRWRDVVKGRAATSLARFDRALGAIVDADVETSFSGVLREGAVDDPVTQVAATPLADVLALRALTREAVAT